MKAIDSELDEQFESHSSSRADENKFQTTNRQISLERHTFQRHKLSDALASLTSFVWIEMNAQANTVQDSLVAFVFSDRLYEVSLESCASLCNVMVVLSARASETDIKVAFHWESEA
jgi:hypothetical protein